MLTLYSAELREAATEELIGSLPAASREKIASRKNRCEAALGELLRLHMMQVSGAPDEVAKGRYGKPYSPSRRDISFSISHSGGFAVGALLLCSCGEVGVDIERIDREKYGHRQKIAERFYTQNERMRISASFDPVTEFYLTWTRKEAYLKYTGEGITRPLLSVDTTGLDAVVVSRVISDSRGAEYAFSVCIGEDGADIPIPDIERIY